MKTKKHKCPECGYYNAHQLGCSKIGDQIKLSDIVKDYQKAKDAGEEYKLPSNI